MGGSRGFHSRKWEVSAPATLKSATVVIIVHVRRKWLVNWLITSKSDCREENIHHYSINYKQRSMKELDLNSMLHINRKYILSTM